jgi:hypothetical protein
MIHPNFHVYVIISTLCFIVLLRTYKSHIEKHKGTKKKSSNFVFVLFIPIVLYTSFYFFSTNTSGSVQPQLNSTGTVTAPYPLSVSTM